MPKTGSFLRVRIQWAVNRVSDRINGLPRLRFLMRRRGNGLWLYGCESVGFGMGCRDDCYSNGASNGNCDRDGGGINACAAKEA